MKFPHFFIERPIFASVIWIITVIVGLISYFALPVEQFPEVVPPTIVVNASYPGANADVISKTVATPLEQAINGVENMLYMSSQSTNDGAMVLTITFKLGTDLDQAQVLVQNRVATAEARLPEEVRRRGVTTRKNSTDLMMVINLYSPDDSFDQTYIANYATLQLKDPLTRIDGVGDIWVFGASDYSMRIWLDPDRIASLGLTGSDVLQALRAQNIQVASGTLGQQPASNQPAFELTVQTQGRLSDPTQFAEIIIKSTDDGRIVRVKDVGQIELGAENYASRGYLGGKKAIALPIFQRPGSNALATANAIIDEMKILSKKFPKGLEYKIIYNPTEFVAQSIDAVYATILEAVALVILVIILFLQSWRAAIIPIVAIPVSLIGTFAMMAFFGFSLNNLTLFGLVLAIGIVVDDAIVVVENMERLMDHGMSSREAAHRTMDEVGGALIAIGVVLVAVFLPTAFITGISGQFFQQFGLVIAVATSFSVAISMTLSPALAAILLKPTKKLHHAETNKSLNSHNASEKTSSGLLHPFSWLFGRFNAGMAYFTQSYGNFVGTVVRRGALMIFCYLLLMGFAGMELKLVPTGFIPAQDQGYFIVGVQLPPGASLERTDAVIQEATQRLLKIKGVSNAVSFAGFNGATFTNASNAGAIFPVLADFKERENLGVSFHDIQNAMWQAMSSIPEAFLVVIPPPPVRGVGNGGGFKMMVQDRGGIGNEQLNAAVWQLAMAANQSGFANNVFSFYEINTPQVYLNIDFDRAEKLGVPVNQIFDALSIYFGSAYVNDFNYLGRTYRVTAQADAPFRMSFEDIAQLRVRSDSGKMVPLGTFVTFENNTGPSRQPRYNLYPAAELQGDNAPGFSTGDVLKKMEELAAKTLPPGVDFEWTDLAYQQKHAGNSGTIAFILAVVFVFLLLAALYESWVLPLAIILIVPMCLLSAITGIWLLGMDNNIMTQIGLIVLIGLASKNAILIVEFAKDHEKTGATPIEAAIQAARLRVRPILMTSFAFILGVVPLVIATGAGAELRQALGVAVFFGMLGVTFFGLIFTPVFYVLCRALAIKIRSLFSSGKMEELET